MDPTLQKIAHEPSWKLENDHIELYLTERGGHLGPATFKFQDRSIQPFHVAPWAGEDLPPLPMMLKVLRGDFFCLPFGANDEPYEGHQHPPHGETANEKWLFSHYSQDSESVSITLGMNIARQGNVEKTIKLKKGHSAIYSQHMLRGFSGPVCPGHHAMLKFPDQERSCHITTSPFVMGRTAPVQLEHDQEKGYSMLQANAPFEHLEQVPTEKGGTTNLSSYPAREGFEDLIMIVSDPDLPFGWTAVSFPEQGYVWFALKNTATLASTTMWFSNGGRHYPPWNSRHKRVVGIEDVTAFFHYGIVPSTRPNSISGEGFPTFLEAQPGALLRIPYIMALAEIPSSFKRVATIEAAPHGQGVLLKSSDEQSIQVPLDLSFITR